MIFREYHNDNFSFDMQSDTCYGFTLLDMNSHGNKEMFQKYLTKCEHDIRSKMFSCSQAA